MNIKHIGININTLEDIERFYAGLLGFKTEYKFMLDASLSERVFGINRGCEVYYLSNGTIEVELFYSKEKVQSGYAHICFETDDTGRLTEKARKAGFLHLYRERKEKEPLIFLKDLSGNIFEIKKSKHV